MKVLLIQPPFTIFKAESKKCHPPLGLAYLAGTLKNRHEVSVLDALAEGYGEESIEGEFLTYGLSFEALRRKIIDILPDAVGVSWLFSAQSKNIDKICEITKDINKKIVTIVGGAHPSAIPEEVLKNSHVDFVVIGEGENTLKILLEHLEYGKSTRDIVGVGFRDNCSIIINQKKTYEENLDNLALPDWDIFPLDKYFQIKNPHGGIARRTPFLPMITSRGCPFECIFCSVHNLWGKTYRKRSVDNIFSEINYLIDKFNVKEILFEDDNLTLDKSRAIQLFNKIIDTKLNFVWSVPNGLSVQTLDNELLELMKKSGCYRISIGVESGDERILRDVIKKNIVLSRVKPVIDKAKSLRMETAAYFVVGLPGETRESLIRTFKFAKNLGSDNVNFFFATPLPGTGLMRVCKEQGLIDTNIDYLHLKSDYPSFSLKDISKEKLFSIVKRQMFIIDFLFLIRNPFKFARKLAFKLFNEPEYFIKLRMKMPRRKCRHSLEHRIIRDTRARYSRLWSNYYGKPALEKYHIDEMQEVIPEKIVRGKAGLEIGCGCGWDIYLMAKNNPSTRIIGIDISDGVYAAKELNSGFNNVDIIRSSATHIPLKSESCDFIYSFGALHHLYDYKKGFLEIRRVLKKGSPCFLYLYDDHSGNFIKYVAVRIISLIRRITVRLPPDLVYHFSCLLSPICIILFTLPAKFFKKFRITHFLFEKMPFNFGSSLLSLKGDIYDRLSVPVERRFSQRELSGLLRDFKFHKVNITKLKATAGWVVWGVKY